MRVLLVNEGCVIGGIETWMITLSAALRARGHTCELFFLQRGPMEAHLPPDCVAHFGGLTDLLRLVDERRFDVVQGHSGDYQLGISAVRALGAALVVTSHGWIIPGWTSLTCDAFLAVSRWLAEGQQPLTDMPVRVVKIGLDLSAFKPDPTWSSSPHPIVAWIGRGTAVEQKRIDKLAAIAPALQQAGLRLWLAEASGPAAVEGVAPEAAAVLRPIADRWNGVPREEMPAFFRAVAASGGCVLSTSSYEGLSVAYVEAQACGCPVIGPDVRGVNEAIQPEYGGVLYPFDLPSPDLARLVIDTIADTDGMQRRRELAIAFAREHFALERMVDEYLDVYRAARDRKRPTLRMLWRRTKLMLHLRQFLLRNWSAAQAIYKASRELDARGEPRLARLTARTALALCPTIYLRPRRLRHLLGVHWRRVPRPAPHGVAAAPPSAH